MQIQIIFEKDQKFRAEYQIKFQIAHVRVVAIRACIRQEARLTDLRHINVLTYLF